MQKILVLGTYHEYSGYGEASRRYIDALLTTSLDVAVRPLYFSGETAPISSGIEDASKKILQPDVVIQICPPYTFDRIGGVPNYGIFFTETSPLPTSWAQHCSVMDGIIQPSHAQAGWCATSPHFSVPSAVIPVPADPNKYSRSYKSPPGLGDRSRFKFYSVLDTSARKNVEGLLRAYFYAFRATENVELVLKGVNEDVVRQVAFGAKLHRYPLVRVLPDRYTDEQMAGLHFNCDCYVSASRSEGWGIDGFDAMFFGKTPIVPGAGGFLDFIGGGGWTVKTTEEPCYGMGETHRELFSGTRLWSPPDLIALAKVMRDAFEQSDVREAKAEIGVESVSQFSYETIGTSLKDFINGQKSSSPTKLIRRIATGVDAD